MKPICFMVMPFRRKAVTSAREGAPKEVDFDRLWDAALMPAIRKLGFSPVRADAEAGSVIVKDMLNRLRHADLVLADVSIPNGNVYYEVGIRHVAQEKRCVLVAADWFLPLFDVNSMRILTYPLANGEVPADQAAAIESVLVQHLPALLQAETPYYVLVDADVERAFASEAERLSRFQVELGAVRQMRKGAARTARIQELVREHADAAKVVPEVALELLYLIRDAEDWQTVCEFVESLSDDVRGMGTIREQYYLALSEVGRVDESIAGLQELLRRFGPTPERWGLVGGRHKRLYEEARERRASAGLERPAAEEREHLTKAIDAYERGFALDLNEYYCSSNLPALLRERGKKGDRERADLVETLVSAACRRAVERQSTDPWLPYTLFGIDFRRGDVAALEESVERVESGVPWRLGSTLRDAAGWIRQAPAERQDELTRILERLQKVHRERS